MHAEDRVPDLRDPAPPIPAVAITVAEACIRSARHSVQLLKEAWIDGSFATFNYFFAQYLFSAATVLAISSLLPKGKENASDEDQFEAAASILYQIRDSGSFAGREFCRHIDAIKTAVEEARRRQAGRSAGLAQPGLDASGNGGTATGERGSQRTGVSPEAGGNTAGVGDPPANMAETPNGIAAEQVQHNLWAPQNAITGTALLESSLHQLLAQPALDLQFIDASIYGDGSSAQGLYWPDITPGGWTPDAWTAP